MDGPVGVGQPQSQQQLPQQQQDQQQAKVVERLNPAVQQQLNLESVKTRAISLFKAITRILEDFDIIARTNSNPKWQDVLGQFSMVNLELYNIVEDIKKVSKAFVVHPKNVNGENAAILPVMISSKLLPEIEADDASKRDQLLYAMQNLSVPSQIEKLKARIDMIGAACESAEKVIADTRKTYFGTRQGPTNIMTLDKAQAAKIQEQENLLRHAVNHGQGLRLPPDQRQITSALPAHLVDVLPVGDNAQTVNESSGMYMKNTPPMVTNAVNNQGALMQGSGSQLMGRAAASPGGTGTPSFDNTTASPLPYANSPRSAANMMNTPSPQQQQTQQQQQQQQFQQQQRQRLMQLPQHQQQQLLAQQLRQNPMAGLAQNQLSQLHDLQGQGQQKYQSLGAQQFQGRQLPSGGMQHGIAQSQLNQGSQLNRHINQMSSAANSALFNAAQGTPNNQMMSNMSAMMPSQPLVPRMQFGLSGGNRTLGSQNMNDQVFNMGAANPNTMMPMQQQQQQQQQQQHGSQGAFGNMQQNSQNLQANMMQNQQQNFQQHRQNNQQ
ncbi:mediator subunit 8 [Artemisia annua]|uniref:Mediator subunit 8 n=1 Tax=Artemisia annua TaxID=35608 RepID=A0A2U1MQF8_ARTAN|nr:mediator subunit 8 [Artemisia annua]